MASTLPEEKKRSSVFWALCGTAVLLICIVLISFFLPRPKPHSDTEFFANCAAVGFTDGQCHFFRNGGRTR